LAKHNKAFNPTQK